jgi:hypothetical protein
MAGTSPLLSLDDIAARSSAESAWEWAADSQEGLAERTRRGKKERDDDLSRISSSCHLNLSS